MNDYPWTVDWFTYVVCGGLWLVFIVTLVRLRRGERRRSISLKGNEWTDNGQV
jgi:hypothetical protein